MFSGTQRHLHPLELSGAPQELAPDLKSREVVFEVFGCYLTGRSRCDYSPTTIFLPVGSFGVAGHKWSPVHMLGKRTNDCMSINSHGGQMDWMILTYIWLVRFSFIPVVILFTCDLDAHNTYVHRIRTP